MDKTVVHKAQPEGEFSFSASHKLIDSLRIIKRKLVIKTLKTYVHTYATPYYSIPPACKLLTPPPKKEKEEFQVLD